MNGLNGDDSFTAANSFHCRRPLVIEKHQQEVYHLIAEELRGRWYARQLVGNINCVPGAADSKGILGGYKRYVYINFLFCPWAFRISACNGYGL